MVKKHIFTQSGFTVSLSLSLPLCLLVASLLLWSAFPVPPAYAAPSISQLEKDLTKEQERATSRKAGLKRLTEQERRLNADLAAAEARILELEAGLEAQTKKLTELARDDDGARQEYEAVLQERNRTEQAQTEALNLLWEISCKRQALGNRNMADWAEVDREYAWTRELFATLEGYRKQIAGQEAQLASVLSRREKLAVDIQQRLNALHAEKARLLQNRLAYEQRLGEVRQERADTEAELQGILRLVDSLNLQITQAGGGDITKLKGKLPWPVKGKVRQKYAPSDTPPSRGIGFTAADAAEVRAVAAGKVVHNNVLRGFGTVLILQHGKEYYSLYAYLGNCPLKVGEEVAGGSSVGSCGYYPAVSGAGLYFELRFKQKAINPEQWFAPLQGSK